MDNYLNFDRLCLFLEKLKTLFATKKEVEDKVDKVSGKGLSTNDYTTDEKIKLSNISSGAEVNVQSDWNVTDTLSDAFIKNKPSIPIYEAAIAAPKAHGIAVAGTSDKYAREDHVHPLQTTISGNAGSATKLQTTRKINGVAFDGSEDISLKAAPDYNAATHQYGRVSSDTSWMGFYKLASIDLTANTDSSMIICKIFHINEFNVSTAHPMNLHMIAHRSDSSHNNIEIYGDEPSMVSALKSSIYIKTPVDNTGGEYSIWWKRTTNWNLLGFTVLGAFTKTGNLATKWNFYHENVPVESIEEDGFNVSTLDSSNSNLLMKTFTAEKAAAATKLATARALQIGNTSKKFDGSANLTWTLDEIGAASSVHEHEDYIPLNGYICSYNHYLHNAFNKFRSGSIIGDPSFDAFAISSTGIISMQEVYGDPFELYLIDSTGSNLSNMSYPADFNDGTASGYYSFSPHCFYPFFHWHDASTLSKCSLGTYYAKWSDIYCQNSVIQTSDRNLKNSIIPISDKYIELFKLLIPVSFQYKDGTSGRTHIGFIAQDVEDAMKQAGLTDLEFAGFCKDKKINIVRGENGKRQEEPVLDEDGNSVYIYSLRYEEFIALNTAMIQKQQKEIASLEDRVSVLESGFMALTASGSK